MAIPSTMTIDFDNDTFTHITGITDIDCTIYYTIYTKTDKEKETKTKTETKKKKKTNRAEKDRADKRR